MRHGVLQVLDPDTSSSLFQTDAAPIRTSQFTPARKQETIIMSKAKIHDFDTLQVLRAVVVILR